MGISRFICEGTGGLVAPAATKVDILSFTELDSRREPSQNGVRSEFQCTWKSLPFLFDPSSTEQLFHNDSLLLLIID